jgi:hypothetical protein
MAAEVMRGMVWVGEPGLIVGQISGGLVLVEALEACLEAGEAACEVQREGGFGGLELELVELEAGLCVGLVEERGPSVCEELGDLVSGDTLGSVEERDQVVGQAQGLEGG